MGSGFGFGLKMLADAQQRFVKSGLPTYLRVRNWVENDTVNGVSSDYLEVGVPIAPTGAPGQEVGYIDIPIDPPPNVEDVSLHNIGLLGARLNFGSQIFWVSDSFVEAQLATLVGVDDPYAVFRERDGHKVIGIVYQSRMFSIESITHRDVGGETVMWKLICNRLETEQTTDG